MKNKFERITALVLALAIIVGSMFCLSSCSSVVFDAIAEIMNSQEKPSGGSDTDLGVGDGGNKPSIPPSDGDGEIADGNVNQNPDTPTDGEGDNESDGNGANNGDGGGGNGNNSTDGSDNTASGDNGTDEEETEFYPGQGSVSADKIDAKNRTLLSTVDIIANFGVSPSAGSGVIYSLDKEKGDAYIITNYHVVYSSTYGLCNSATLYLYGMRYEKYAIEATVVGGSANYDIAVLKVVGSEVLKNSYAMAATLGNSDDVRVFDDVYVVGNAEGYGMSATEGIVSVDSEDLEMDGADGSHIELRVMRVSAAINKGNSGGGLYDENGQLIGIVVAKRVGSDVDNMGYAIPINLAKNLAENILYFCSDGTKTGVQRPLIGITITSKVIGLVVDETTGELIKSEKIEISELTETCIAKDKVKVGDVVNTITIDGVCIKVTRLYHIIDHMLTARVGSEVTMNLTRDGETIEVSFTVPESAFTAMK